MITDRLKGRKKGQVTLSIIIANYNNAKYLDDCLQSVLKQTYQDYEIIIVDDGSTDESTKILRSYSEKYPAKMLIVFQSRRRGPARSRHQGIQLSAGKYITTLDSDDYFYDERKLEKEIELITHSESNGKDIMAFSNIMLIREDRSVIGLWGNAENIKQGMIFNEIFTRSCLIPRDFILKKEIYREVGGYDPRILIYEDWDLKIRLAKKYDFLYTGYTGTAYRRHGRGLSNSPGKVHRKWLQKICKKNLRLAEKSDRSMIEQKVKIFINSIKNNHQQRSE